ncbi:MAG: hypothetical protein C0623_09640 [Desulfuromonas sp.]|nr:MAG: hypothetical protein C0623_09640 [Desulfuromonas sp.]
MKKIKKILLISGGLLVVLLVALILLVNVLITPERVRETVLPLAEDALQRKVSIGDIQISLFSGITLQDLDIARKDGNGSFIAAENVVLRYSLLSLLMLKVEIDEASLVRPRFEVVRYDDGSFNFSDLIDEKNHSGEVSPGTVTPETGSAPVDVQVSRIGVTDGRLLFIDHAAVGGPIRHEVSAFNFNASNVAVDSPFPIDLSAIWNENTLGLHGKINPVAAGGDLEATFNRVKVLVAGAMSNQKIKATVELPKTTFADIFESIPDEYAPDIDTADFKGSIQVLIRIDDDVVETSDFVARINGQVLKLELSASNLFDEIIKIRFSCNSESINIDEILPPTDEGPATGSGGESNSKAEEIGPFSIPVDLVGDVRIDSIVYNQIPLRNLQLNVTLKNNILLINNLSAAVADGEFKETAKINLGAKGFVYDTRIDLKGVNGGEIIKLVKPELADSVEGVLAGQLNLAGTGTVPETIKKTISGEGLFTLAQGKLQNIPALDSTATLLGIGEMRKIILDDGDIALTIQNGEVELRSMIDGPTTRLSTSGIIGLSGRMDIHSRVALSPELGGRLHENGKLTRYLGDENGWTSVPLRIKGDYSSPEVSLDRSGLKKQAEEVVRKKVQEKLEEKLQNRLQDIFGK